MNTGRPDEINPRTLAALKRINANVTKALGERTCWSLGDVIIALETPDDAYIYTTDRHFDLIVPSWASNGLLNLIGVDKWQLLSTDGATKSNLRMNDGNRKPKASVSEANTLKQGTQNFPNIMGKSLLR